MRYLWTIITCYVASKSMIEMQSKRLYFELLDIDHADELFPILTTPSVLAFIDPTGNRPILEEVRAEYACRMKGPINLAVSTEQWFNMAIYLKAHHSKAIGRLEATSYDGWGEIAYLLGEPWWGKGLAFEAMNWWHEYLEMAVPETKWWATVHPENQRSIRLLSRLGYEKIDSSNQPKLQSYDLGDLCFVRTASV